MAQYADVVLSSGTTPTNIVCFNNSLVDIAKGYGVLYETVAGYPRAVKLPGAGDAVVRAAGVTAEIIPAGGYGKVTVNGPAIAFAGGVLTTGAKVMIGSVAGHLGECIVTVVTATSEELGHVLQASAADGDKFEIFVNIHTLPKAA
ncbi:MAG: hypothetical protein WC563_15560 [Brevundimonas sp.]